MNSEELTNQIRQNLAKPASASTDGQSASQFSLADQIAAVKFLQEQEAQANRSLGITLTKIKLGGPF